MVRLQTWQARRFEIFESARHFRIESNRDVRFEFESKLRRSPVSFEAIPRGSLGVRKFDVKNFKKTSPWW